MLGFVILFPEQATVHRVFRRVRASCPSACRSRFAGRRAGWDHLRTAALVAFHATPGYETYIAGLGWYVG